jgi:hypothetical protein
MNTYKDFDDKVEWLYCEDCGVGQFLIARAVEDKDSIAFVYLDKHGYYNVFRSMDEYNNYVEGVACERICVSDEDFSYNELPEGVDFIDAWTYDNLKDINKAFETVARQ